MRDRDTRPVRPATLAGRRPRPGPYPPPRHVQDLVREDGATLWPLLEQGGVVYVCGDGGRMEPAVRVAVTRLAVDHGGLDPEAAAAWQADLAAANRYLADVWGVRRGSGIGDRGSGIGDRESMGRAGTEGNAALTALARLPLQSRNGGQSRAACGLPIPSSRSPIPDP